MSTKTTFKRIALVAVAALGLGVLSVAPSSAAVGTSAAVTVSENGTATTKVSDSSTAAAFSVVFFQGQTFDTVTVSAALKSLPTGAASISPTLMWNESVTAQGSRAALNAAQAANLVKYETTTANTAMVLRTSDSSTASKYVGGNFKLVLDTSTAGNNTVLTAGTYTFSVVVTPYDNGVINLTNQKLVDVTYVVSKAADQSATSSAALSTAVLAETAGSEAVTGVDDAISVEATASSTAAVFNVASPGDTSHEMYQQAVDLVNRMRASSRIDFLNSWKVVTFFVGGNDLCKSCKDTKKYSVNNYVNNIKKTLDYFKANLPRTFVNLVLTLDVRGIQVLTGTTCRNMQKTFCDCALTDSFLPTLDTLTKGYQKGVEDLIATGIYDTKDDFTVVLQPFMKLMKPPLKPDGTPNYSLFAPDCFHFSTAGHQIAAVELWNSMMTPVGRKPEKWTMSSNALCPSSNAPFLYTKKNSPIF